MKKRSQWPLDVLSTYSEQPSEGICHLPALHVSNKQVPLANLQIKFIFTRCFDFEKLKTEMGLFKNYKLTGGKATSKQLYKGFCIHAAVKNHPPHLVLGILPSHSLASTSFLLLKVWLLSMGPHCHFLRQHFGKVLFKKHCRKETIQSPF